MSDTEPCRQSPAPASALAAPPPRPSAARATMWWSPTSSRRRARPSSPTIKAAGGSAEFHRLDVRSTEQADAVVADVEARHGRHRHHRRQCRHRAQGAAAAADRRQVGLHLRHRSQGHLPRRARRRSRHEGARSTGSDHRLSSIMGVAYGWDEHVHYSAAKSGVVGLVRGLAVELARDGIRVNGIAPGYIRTAQLLSEENSLGPAGADKAGRVHSDGPPRRARGHRGRHRISGFQRREHT